MFLPIKADFPLPRFPWLTVLVCLICIGVFVKQQSDWRDFGMAMERFCNSSRSHLEQIVFDGNELYDDNTMRGHAPQDNS